MKVFRIHDGSSCVVWATESGGRFYVLSGLFPHFKVTGQVLQPKGFLPPVECPPAVYGIGLNYRQHAAEMGVELPLHPVLFMKSPSCLAGHGQPIEIPVCLGSSKVDWEVELAVVIGKSGKNIPRERAFEHVFGYTVANDVTARDWQKHGGANQWTRGKNFDTSCPLGPCIVTADELPNPHDLELSCIVNGSVFQQAKTSDLHFGVDQLIAFISRSTTLAAGTVILTGTPSGVGMSRNPMVFLKPGDWVECTINGIGTLSNPVVDETVAPQA